MADKNQNRYEILRDLAKASSKSRDWKPSAEAALQSVSAMLSLEAASIILWDSSGKIVTTVSYSNSDQSAERLNSLENDLFYRLRKDRELLSAHLSFGGIEPIHSFSIPLRYTGTIFGAILGFQTGERTAITEDSFLDALACSLTLNSIAGGSVISVSQDELENERKTAISEVAVTVNHEINNPLTAILGNVQLLLFKRDDLDDELKEKLDVIEKSATRIRDVTQKLLKFTSGKSIKYAEGTTMLDINSSEEENGDESISGKKKKK